MKPRFFKSPSDLQKWFANHHGTKTELLVGYYKKDSGKKSVTWPESVDEALCVGWIDGIRRRIDDLSYSIRFTARRARSVWSAVNIKRVQELSAQGRMQPEGLKAFAARNENRSGIYSYEQRPQDFPDLYKKQLKKNKAAWKFFEAQPPSYRKAATWWVLSAKKEETRLMRLSQLIEHSAHQRHIPQFLRTKS